MDVCLKGKDRALVSVVRLYAEANAAALLKVKLKGLESDVFLRYNICEIVKRYIKICVLAGNILRTERTANCQRNDHN